jgi:hypothetical protein
MVGQRMKPQENVSFRLKNIMSGTKKTLRRTFVSLGKTVFSPFGRKKQTFFLRKQNFASEFFCPWHNVSSKKEHIFQTVANLRSDNEKKLEMVFCLKILF